MFKMINIYFDDNIESFEERKHTIKFEGEWIVIKGGYELSEIVFVASARKIKFIKVE